MQLKEGESIIKLKMNEVFGPAGFHLKALSAHHPNPNSNPETLILKLIA